MAMIDAIMGPKAPRATTVGGVDRVLSAVLAAAAAHGYCDSLSVIKGPARVPWICHVRQAAMFWLRDFVVVGGVPISYPRIATILGGRDHTTAMHGVRSADKAWGPLALRGNWRGPKFDGMINAVAASLGRAGR